MIDGLCPMRATHVRDRTESTRVHRARLRVVREAERVPDLVRDDVLHQPAP
jgi:hypothetical protein